DVAVSNADNDAAAINVSPLAGLATTEAGGTATFQVVLASQPTADVTIPVASNNAAERVAAPASLTFTPANWNQAQSVTVTGVADAVQDATVSYRCVLGAAASAAPPTRRSTDLDVAVSNADNDAAAINVAPIAGLATTEAGGTATFQVVLASQPVGDVAIPVGSSNAAEGVASPAHPTVTPSHSDLVPPVPLANTNDPS